MPEDIDSASDDDDRYTEADRNRISELFPRCVHSTCWSLYGLNVYRSAFVILLYCCRDLAAVFAPSPQNSPKAAPHDQPLAVAGADSRPDVSLERMQASASLAALLSTLIEGMLAQCACTSAQAAGPNSTCDGLTAALQSQHV